MTMPVFELLHHLKKNLRYLIIVGTKHEQDADSFIFYADAD